MGSSVSQHHSAASSYHHKTHNKNPHPFVQYHPAAHQTPPPIDATPQSPNSPTKHYSQTTPKYATEVFDFQVEQAPPTSPPIAAVTASRKRSKKKKISPHESDTLTVHSKSAANRITDVSGLDTNPSPQRTNAQATMNEVSPLKSPTLSSRANVALHLDPPSPFSATADIPSPMNDEKPLSVSVPHLEDSYDLPRNYCQSQVAELLFVVVSAIGIKASDLNGLSDPYARITLLNSKFSLVRQTRTIMKTLHPRWNENFWFHVVTSSDDKRRPSDRHLRVELYDYDRVTKDDFLASVDFDLMHLMTVNESPAQELVLPFQKGKGRLRCIVAWRMLPNPSIPVFPSNGVHEYYTQSCLMAIDEAWNCCVRAEKKDSRWKLHEYSDSVWIVRLEGFQGKQNPMEGALIFCTLTFKPSFPDTLPQVQFLTNFLHPNIDDNRELVHNFSKLKDSSPKELSYFLDVVVRLVEKPSLKIAVNKQLAVLYTLKQGYEAEGHRYYERVRGDIEKYAI